MKDLSEITVCVVDSGLFLTMARRMSEDCKRAVLWNPDDRAFASVKQAWLGDGFDNVERVQEFWPMLSEIDLFCFPDSRLSGLQLYLESIGKAVWGSRRGQDLERKRGFFMDTLSRLGLDVPPHEVINGLPALRDYLRDKEDVYIKSNWRGDMETFHWRNWRLDEGWLDWMAVNLGPQFKCLVTFYACAAIKTDLEIGGDTYTVDGKWPSLMLSGIEGKDKSYFSAVTKRQDMPEQLREIMDAFSEMFYVEHYRNQISMEVRVKGEKSYYIDATQRGGMPSTASQHLLWKNFPLIVWAGANGELVEPEPAAKFSIETMITSSGGAHDCYDVVEIPESLEPWCRFSNCAYVDGLYVFPPDELKGNDLGWLCAIGDTPAETLEESKRLADLLPDGLNADVESLAAVIQEIESAREQGVEVANDAEMPEPAEVL